MKKKGRINTTYMVQLSLLIAIVILMAFTPIGYLKIGPLEMTLIVVPVAIGAVVLGPAAGAILGAVFGITSFIQCFGMSPFGAVLLSINPVYTFIVCVVSRTLMGWFTGLIYAGLRKSKKIRKASVAIANVCCPLLNTLLFMGTLVLFFYQTDYIQRLVQGYEASNVFAFVILFVGINGLIEALVCFAAGTAVSEILIRVVKQTSSGED